NLIKRFCTTRLTRQHALRGLAAGVAAVVTGAAFAAGDGEAKKKKKKKKVRAAAPSCRALGEACQSDASCCGPQSQTHLACQFVGETGARRCECTTGFTACGGVCVSITCPGGAQLDFTTCQCVCP